MAALLLDIWLAYEAHLLQTDARAYVWLNYFHLSYLLTPTWRSTSQLCKQHLRSHALLSCMSELTLQCSRQ